MCFVLIEIVKNYWLSANNTCCYVGQTWNKRYKEKKEEKAVIYFLFLHYRTVNHDLFQFAFRGGWSRGKEILFARVYYSFCCTYFRSFYICICCNGDVTFSMYEWKVCYNYVKIVFDKSLWAESKTRKVHTKEVTTL